ncbi:MAG: hypothetical protein R3D25_22830 [Geminicoccaceae bacterium]
MRAMGFAISLVGCLLCGPAGAAGTAVDHGPFTVERVALLGLRGTLRVEVVPGTTTTLHVEGPRRPWQRSRWPRRAAGSPSARRRAATR